MLPKSFQSVPRGGPSPSTIAVSLVALIVFALFASSVGSGGIDAGARPLPAPGVLYLW
jgi:hypothetical protein